MQKSVNTYTDTSISAYEGPEALRRRPQTLLGSADINGCIHTIMEIIANSTDEAVAGFGNQIDVTIYEDDSVEVVDRGRGVPMAWNEKQGKFNWELVFNTLYASGKGNKDAAYNDSEGLNGCGCTATQFTSDYMDVESIREILDENEKGTGEYHKYIMHFEKGWPVGQLQDIKLTGKVQTGTRVKFRPSSEVFNGDVTVPREALISRLALKAIGYAGLKYVYTYKGGSPMTFYYEGGMQEFLTKNVAKPLTPDMAVIKAVNNRCNDTKDNLASRTYTAEMECCILFSSDSTVQSTFHNGALLKGGPTHEAVLTGISKAITAQAKAGNKLSAKDKFTNTDIAPIINFICQTRCNADYCLWENQTKVALNNPSIVKMIASNVEVQLTKWFSDHQTETVKIIDFAVANKTARESADKVRRNVIKQLSQDIRKIGKEPDGFVDCITKDSSKAELYIIEGESAKGSAVFARDKETQAIQPLRGKIPNCLKKPLEQLLSENSLILQLLTEFGCGIEVQSKTVKDLPKFDESKLNFDKIILGADADVDGGHIIVLCITMIWVMCPTLLRKGHVYTVKTPLWRVTCQKHSEYFYNDAEKDACLRMLKARGAKPSQIEVKRFKGLGEMESPDLKNTVMDKNKRQLQRLTCPESEAEFSKMLNTLMGTDVTERRELIVQNFDRVEATAE